MSGPGHPQVLFGLVGLFVQRLAVSDAYDIVGLAGNDQHGAMNIGDFGDIVELVKGQNADSRNHPEHTGQGAFENEPGRFCPGRQIDGGSAAQRTAQGDDAIRLGRQIIDQIPPGRIDIQVHILLGRPALARSVAVIVVGKNRKTPPVQQSEELTVVADVFGIAVTEKNRKLSVLLLEIHRRDHFAVGGCELDYIGVVRITCTRRMKNYLIGARKSENNDSEHDDGGRTQ